MPKKVKSSSYENIFVSEAHRTIYIEISYLKKRIHLVEGERKANFESNEDHLKKNEDLLKQLRDQNSKLKKEHKLTLNDRGSYFKQISERLGGQKHAHLFKEKNFSQAIDIFECKMGDLKNKLNLLQFKKASLNDTMKNILDEEKELRLLLSGKTIRENPGVLELKTIETSVAAMQMKIVEAENIRARYKNMLLILKSENFNRNIKVTELAQRIELENKELCRVEQVLQEALKARKIARMRLAEVEDKTIEEYSEREQELYESRLKLKQIREKMDAIGARLSYPKFHMIHRDSSITEGLYLGTDQSVPLSEIKEQTTIESVYNTLAEMTGESDPVQIVIRFIEQRQHAKALAKQEEEAKSEVRKAKLLKRFLLDKLGQLQFSGGLRREKLNERGNKINSEITNTHQQRDDMDKTIVEYANIMDQMAVKLSEICDNNDLKPFKSNNESSGERTVYILKHILNKIEQIFEDQENAFMSQMSPIGMLLEKEYMSENESYLSTLSPSYRIVSSAELNALDPTLSRKASVMEGMPLNADSGNLDISDREQNTTEKMEAEDAKIKPPGKRSDSSEEEEAVTRNFVKRQSQILIEAKTRKGRFNPSTNLPTRHRRY